MSPDQDWTIEFYLAADLRTPGSAFLNGCPVGRRLEAIIESVRAYPPYKYPTTLMWHAMRLDMKGIHEARARNRNLLHRLFCVLDKDQENILGGPAIIVLGGGTKPMNSAMDSDVYEAILEAKDRYWATKPRPITLS
jgi:hypothetical protein